MSELFSQNFAVNAFNNAFNCPSIEGRFYCSEENEDTIIEYIRSDIVPVLIERYESGEPNDYDNVLVVIKNKIKITCSLKTKVGSMKKSLTKTKNVPKKKFVDLYLDESKESYFIKGSSYTGKIDLDIVIGSWWNHKIIQSEKNISPISGSINKQTINFIKKEKLKLYGKVYDTRHFVILSKRLNKEDSEERRYDVWLDINTNHILKMTYSKYGLWEYKLKQVIYSK